MSIRIGANRAGLLVVAIAGCAALLLTAGLLGFAYVFFRPPDGPPLATRDIQPGQPFELKFPATGEAVRLWLDMRCDSCGFPVEGTMNLSARGTSFMSAEISAGDTQDHAWGGHNRWLEQHLLFDAPARPPGDEVTVTGTLTVRGARGPLGAPVKGAPAPTMHVFRLTVTN